MLCLNNPLNGKENGDFDGKKKLAVFFSLTYGIVVRLRGTKANFKVSLH